MADWKKYIEWNPQKLFGKPVIKGTRIPVDLLLEKLAKGESMESLFEAYPGLTKDALQAVFAYAADAVRHELVYKI